MASASIPTASAASQAASSAPRFPPAAASAAGGPGTSSSVSHLCPSRPGRPSLNLPLKQKLFFSSKVPASSCSGVGFVPRAQQLNDIIVGNDAAAPAVSKKEAGSDLEKEDPLAVQLSPEAVTEFMNQVSDLVKLVDSKDVVELQLKQPGCELLIRKKEALPQPPPPQVVMMPSHAPQAIAAPAYAPPPPAAAGPPASAPAPAASPAPAAAMLPPPTSSHPPIKSPMAGTFYRSPAPGQPPFVMPGDKVRKGQVLCIIEAMKLMNEIEADHEGTVVDILAEDAKPVGVNQPLFVIA